MKLLRTINIFCVGILLLSAGIASAQDLTIGNYTLISKERVSRTEYNYTYQADITNTGSDVKNVMASLTSNSPHTTVVDGTLSFGDVASGTTVTSSDTFTIKQNRLYPLDWSDVVWDIQCVQILGPSGGTFEGESGVAVTIPSGATDQSVPISIEPVQEDELGKDVPSGCTFVGAVALDIGDVVLDDNADVTIPCPSGVPGNAQIYVAKVVEYAGTQMFMMVDTATVQGDSITSQDPAFPGIIDSGTFVFLWADNVGWIGGQVTYAASGDEVPGAVVTLSGGYWLDIADDNGYCGLPAWAGNFVVVAFDDQTGEHGEKQGYMPSDGATVVVNVQIGESSGPVQNALTNGDFETGDLTGWELSGAGDVITSLGPISPYEGNYMAMISSGSGAVGDASSALEQSFTVPAGATTLTIHYNFVSEEYPEFVGSVFNDVFNATLHTPDGSVEVAFEEVNSANFQPVSGIPCGSGDCTWGQTGWLTASIDVSQWAGTDDTITLTVHDVGDTIYDTVVLLDNLTCRDDVKIYSYHDTSKKFVFSRKVVEQGTNYLRAQVRLLSGAGCWYLATPNFSQSGTPIDKTEVYYLAPYGNILIDDQLRFEREEYFQLDIDRSNVAVHTMTALDVILRGIFSKKLEDVLTNDKDKITFFIGIVKESGLVSGLDTGTAYLLAGEYIDAAKEYLKAMKQIADYIGHDQMEQIFVEVLGNSGEVIWNTGITALLQIISLPDKYFLLKEIADNYVLNPGPWNGYVRLEAH